EAPRAEIDDRSRQVSMLRKSFSPVLYPDQVDTRTGFTQLNALITQELKSQFLLNLEQALHICRLGFSAGPRNIISIVVVAEDGVLAHRRLQLFKGLDPWLHLCCLIVDQVSGEKDDI